MTDAALQTTCHWCGQDTDHSLAARAIVDEVAQEHRIPVNDIYRRDRRKRIVAARACAIRRIDRELRLSTSAIAEIFGQDHTTILHHLNGGNGARAAATSRQAQG